MTSEHAGCTIFMIAYNNSSDIPDLPATTHGYLVQIGNGSVFIQKYFNFAGREFFRIKNGAGTVYAWRETTLKDV